MKIATSELEHLRKEVKNCHRIIKDLQKKRAFFKLTDEEIAEAVGDPIDSVYLADFRKVEAALRSKNT